jgi:glycolate dehydrogenase FAD-binding subunit
MSGLEIQVRSLGEIVGEANTSAEPQRLLPYAIDGRQPAMLAMPSNAEEIAEILKFCAAHRLAVVPAGAGTKLRMGATPERYDVALVTTRMDKIVAYDPGDLTISVEAGARLGDVMARLAENRQLLPLTVPFLHRASVGGTVASGVDSPLRQFYGTVRDFLMGVEFVTGDGIRAKSGGRVVKNVAGYDLHKLFIGSLGTLGVITRLNFKTFPVPEASGGFLASFSDASGALELLRKIRHSPLRPSALEILSPSLTDLLARRAAPADAPQDSGLPRTAWVVAADFGGSEAVLRRYVNEMETMAGAAGAIGSSLPAEGVRTALWEGIRETVPLLIEESPGATVIRASVLPSQMGELFSVAQRCGDRYELPVAMLARAAGVAYIAFLPRESNEGTTGRLAQAAAELADAAQAAQGFSFVAWCPAELKARTPLWGKERGDWALMRKVKQSFDPEAVMSPGRFIGGI